MDEEIKTNETPIMENDELKNAIESQLSKIRRQSMLLGFQVAAQSVLDKMRKLQKQDKKGGKPVVVRTHCRDMIVIPEMVGTTFGIYNGRDFVEVTFTPEMLGCFFGEFAPTRARVQHGDPGMGATRSSMFVPLK